jgi:hypothetical protein
MRVRGLQKRLSDDIVQDVIVYQMGLVDFLLIIHLIFLLSDFILISRDIIKDLHRLTL